MKLRKTNDWKRGLAMLLICLLVMGVSPYGNAGISYAEADETGEGTTDDVSDSDDDVSEMTNDGTDDGTGDGVDDGTTDNIIGEAILTSTNSNLQVKTWIEIEQDASKAPVGDIRDEQYFCSGNLKLCVNIVDENEEVFQISGNARFKYNNKTVSKDITNGEAILKITEDLEEGNEIAYLQDVVSIEEINIVGMECMISNPISYNILIDKTPPVIEVTGISTKSDAKIFEKKGEKEGVFYYYYTDKKYIVFKVTANESDTDIEKLTITNNGKKCTGAQIKGKNATATIQLKKLSGESQNITITAVNKAGNSCSVHLTCYKDTKAPKITGFIIPEGESSTIVEADSQTEEVDSYEYFFNTEKKIRVCASDGDTGSGAEEIEVRIKKNLSTDIDEKNDPELDILGMEQKEKGESYAIAMVPDGVKGQVYAKATDHLGNGSDYFVCHKGIITESETMHNSHEHISIQLPYTPYKDDKGQNLYGGNIKVPVIVTDEISGVYSVEQALENTDNSEKKDYCEVFNKDNNKVNVDDSANDNKKIGNTGWYIKDQDANLAVKVDKTFAVSNDQNDITFHVGMEDCAGNRSEASKTFSIDKTKPEITVTFDNNESDPDYPHVYNQPRTATISVKERNFISSGMNVEITSSTGKIPAISGWTTVEDKKNPNNTISTATVTFSEDGDYTMSVGGYDKVKNQADTVIVDDFTIDRTVPTIDVTFDKTNAQNCYGEARTAFISITEHNFAPERVKIIGNVSNASAGTTFPQADAWSHNGDVHTAAIHCEMDGDYQFDVEYADQAGNVGQRYSSETYIIDKMAPVIEITGVENFSANNGDVIPVVSITDRMYDAESVNIQLTGRNRGVVEYVGEFSWLERGQRFTFENFPKESVYDDLYTLHVKAADLAGNISEAEIIFSVNRFGSVYVFDEKLAEMDGRYINTEQSVRLKEINVDSLKRGTVDIIVDMNGTPRELAEGANYTIRQSGGETGWYCYDYDIDESVFAGDGRYIVTVYSEDRAGNRNQNTEESKKAEIRFGVDKTAPIVTSINVESSRQYSTETKQAVVAVKDNLVLDHVAIYVDGKESDYTVSGENYIFEIPGADRKQNISVVATDMAGNIKNYMIEDVLVSTNLFARWFYNTKLFVASIIAMTLMVGYGIGTILMRRRKRSEQKFGRKPGIVAGMLLLAILLAGSPLLSVNARAVEAEPLQQKQISVLQMVVIYTDKDGEEHPVQGGAGFLIGTESANAEYMVTAKEVTSVPAETEQQVIELFGDQAKDSRPDYSVKAVVKRDVMIDAQLVAESDEMGFAIWKLSQPLYDRQALILCDEPLTGVSGQKATVLGFPTAPDLTGETVYYSMDEMVSKEGMLIGDGNENNIKYLYHNITPNPGMVGGPVLNADGNVIAINQSRQAQEGYYALQMSELLPVLEALGIPYVTAGEIEARKQAELAAMVHKEDLQKAILDAQTLDEKRYYKKTYAALTDSLEEAIRVSESETATQEETNGALAALNTAMAELKEKPPAWVMILIIMAVAAMAAVLFVIWWKKSKPKREEKKQKKLEEFTVTEAAPKFTEKAVPKEDYRELVKPVSQDVHPSMPTGPQRAEEIYGETTIFQQDAEPQSGGRGAYLIRMRTGERIVITGREFLIGKDPSQTDYCIKGNSAISRVHAVIINTGLGYDIADKNATNGTFVNNVKVAAFQKATLKSGDILRLADEDFEFKLSGTVEYGG